MSLVDIYLREREEETDLLYDQRIEVRLFYIWLLTHFLLDTREITLFQIRQELDKEKEGEYERSIDTL